MTHAIRTLLVAIVGCLAIAAIVGWVLLGMFLVSIGRDGWAMTQFVLTVFLVMWGIIAALEDQPND